MAAFHNKFCDFGNDPDYEEMRQKLQKSKFKSSLNPIKKGESKIFKSPMRPISSSHNSGRDLRKRRSSRNVMKVANIIVDLGDIDDTSEDSEESGENDSELNLNATYSAKMGYRKYSKMLEAIKEIELGDNVDDDLDQVMSNLDIGSNAIATSHRSSKEKNTNMPCAGVNGYHKSKKRLCEVESMNGGLLL